MSLWPSILLCLFISVREVFASVCEWDSEECASDCDSYSYSEESPTRSSLWVIGDSNYIYNNSNNNSDKSEISSKSHRNE